MFLNIVDRKSWSTEKLFLTSSGTMVENNRFVNNAYKLP